MAVRISFLPAREVPYKVFEQVTGPRHLRAIYDSHVRSKQVRGRDGSTPESLQGSLTATTRLISRRLRSGDYKFTQYRELTISRGAGKTPRILSIPTARDRIALRSLAEFLSRVFPFTEGVLASRRVADAIAGLEENVVEGRPFDAFVRLDVKDFYPSIRHSDIEARLRSRVKKSAARSALMRAVRTPTVADRYPASQQSVVGVPQGLAVSNALAELVARPIDEKFRSDGRCRYYRYVDDILLICNRSDVKGLSDEVVAAFRKYDLTVHPLNKGGKSNTGTLRSGFDFLGYVFKDSGRAHQPIQLTVRKSSVLAIEARLSRIFTEFRKRRGAEPELAALVCELKLNLAIAGCIFEEKPRGWLPYYRQLNDLTLLKRLDSLVRQHIERYQLPSGFKPKKFVRAYWALRYSHGRDAGYIRSFDNLEIAEQREILKIILGTKETEALSDEQVPDAFKKAIGQIIAEFELDIGDRS